MLVPGDLLQERYRIVREIGAGGQGMVYEGENIKIRRRVAIKVLRGAGESGGQDGPSPEEVARFEREAQVASLISSDHITQVLDLGELPSGQHFIVMEYLSGESLRARLEHVGTMLPEVIVPIARQVLVALGAAHAAGVIHRDIKPDNVFLLDGGSKQPDFVKLLDFGISKLTHTGQDARLTLTGAIVGTPTYMAPEQVGGGHPTPLWDLYAVGVILYRGLTGDAPFRSTHLNDLVFRIIAGQFEPPRSRCPDLDPELDAIVCQALAPAAQRFQTAQEFVDALDDWLDTARKRPRDELKQTAVGLGLPDARGGRSAAPAQRTPGPTPRPTLSQTIATPTTRLTGEVELAPARSRMGGIQRTLAVAGMLGAVGGTTLWLWNATDAAQGRVESLRPDADEFGARDVAAAAGGSERGPLGDSAGHGAATPAVPAPREPNSPDGERAGELEATAPPPGPGDTADAPPATSALGTFSPEATPTRGAGGGATALPDGEPLAATLDAAKAKRKPRRPPAAKGNGATPQDEPPRPEGTPPAPSSDVSSAPTPEAARPDWGY